MKYLIYFLLTISLQAQIFLDGSGSTLSASDIDAGNIIVGTADTQQVVISVDKRYVTVNPITTTSHLTEIESDSFIVTAGTDYSFGIVLDTDTVGAFIDTVTIYSGAINGTKEVIISWDVISTDSLILAENSLAIATIDTFYLGNGVISVYTTDSLYLINQTNHYMDLVDIINYGDLGYDFGESRVEADSFMFGIFSYTPSIDDTVNQNIKVVYKPYRAGYSDNSLDTIDLVIKVEVQINANTLLAPQNLLASSNNSTGNEITWDDNNIPDTVAYIDYDFNTSGQLADFTAGWTTLLTLESNKLKVTDNGATEYPSADIIVDVISTKTYKISVDCSKGTGANAGIKVSNIANTVLYDTSYSSIDTTFIIYIANPSVSQIKIWLEGNTPSGGYLLFDNLVIEQTETSVDSFQLFAQDYYFGVPNSDWYLLTSGIGSGGYYLHTGIVNNSIYGYKARFKKNTDYSNYSNADTALFNVVNPEEDIVVANNKTGTYDYVVPVRLTPPIIGSRIYYTVDGTTPTTSSSEYFRPIIVDVSGTTIKAISEKGGVSSDVMSETYTINSKYNVVSIGTGTTYLEAEGSQNNVGVYTSEDDFASNGAVALVQDYYGAEPMSQVKIRFTPSTSTTYYFWGRVGAIMGEQMTVNIVNESTSGSTSIWTAQYTSDSTNWLGYGLSWETFGSISLTAGTTYYFSYRQAWSNNEACELLDKICITTVSSYEPPEFLILSPDGGERWAPDSTNNITWISNGNSSNVKLEYTDDDGATWNTISASTDNDSLYSWTTPSDTGDNYRVRITDVDGSENFIESYNNFFITNIANATADTLTFAKNVDGDIYDGISNANATTLGQNQYLMAAKGHIDSLASSGNTNVPKIGLLNAFRLYNNSVTHISDYNNLNSISGGGPEGMMPKITSTTAWQLTDMSDNWITGSYSRKGLYIWSDSYLDALFANMGVYRADSIQSYHTDSFTPLQRQNAENPWNRETAFYMKNKTTGLMFTWKEWTDGKLRFTYKLQQKSDSLWGAGGWDNGVNGMNRTNIMNTYHIFDWAWGEGWMGITGNLAAGAACATCPAGTDTIANIYNYFGGNTTQNDIEALLLMQRKDKDIAVLGTGWWHPSQTQSTGRMYHFCGMLLGLSYPEFKIIFTDYFTGFRGWAGMDLQKKRFVPLGRFEEISHNVFKRDFQYATVYVNNNLSSAKTVSFSASYYMEADGTWSVSTATSRSIPAMSGLIISTQKTDIE